MSSEAGVFPVLIMVSVCKQAPSEAEAECASLCKAGKVKLFPNFLHLWSLAFHKIYGSEISGI